MTAPAPRQAVVSIRGAFLALLLTISASDVRSQDVPPEQVPPPSTATTSSEPVPQTPPADRAPQIEPADAGQQTDPTTATTDTPPAETDDAVATDQALGNPCNAEVPENETLLDRYRRELFETICGTAARFDRLFGSQRFDEEARRTNGRVGVRFLYDEHDGFEVDGKFRVNVDFPNLEHRINAFLGKEDRDDFVRGTSRELDFMPTFFEREGDEEWLVGFGYRPARGDRTSLDLDAGVEGGSPLDPFVRGRYRYYRIVGEKNLLRARQTVYWTNEKELGTATRLDFERPFGERTLARWTGNAALDGETRGTDWNSGVTVYHGFSPDRAVAWYVGADGETGRDVSLEDYGTTFTYRQRMFRHWFFGELISGVTWPRDKWTETRDAAFHIGFGFEIQFSGDAFALRGSGAPLAVEDIRIPPPQ